MIFIMTEVTEYRKVGLISSDDFETVQTKFTAVWSQIADKFSGYDQRLMFESMNEIKISGRKMLLLMHIIR